MKLIVLNDAEEDLREIGSYTLTQWGIEQALYYLDKMDSVFEKLRENPYIGLACDDIRLGYRKHTAEQHTVFYQVSETTITIIRILDQRMEAEQHLQ